MLMMMTVANGILPTFHPTRAATQPTQMDIAQFSRAPTNNATAMRNRRFQKSLSVLEIEGGKEGGKVREWGRPASIAISPSIQTSRRSLCC